jgi:hypothetical protein
MYFEDSITSSSQLTVQQPNMLAKGPPYAPRTQGLGGTPELIPDVPIAAVFLVLYLIFGIIHIKIFKANKGRGHKFIFNGAILGTNPSRYQENNI